MMGHEPPERKRNRFRLSVWTGLILLGCAAVTTSYFLVDPVVSGWLERHPNTWHENGWLQGFRQLGKAGVPIWLLLAWGSLTDRWRPTFVGIAAVVLVGVSVCPLKSLVQRCRPRTVIAASRQGVSLQNIPWHDRTSFPSGDTATAFAVAIVLSSFAGGRWGPAWLAAAGGVGLLRVTALTHYPSDVIAGAFIGVLCGLYAVRRTARWYAWDEFQMSGPWRIVLLLILIFVVPFVARLLGLTALRTFLRTFFVPLAGLALIAWRVGRRRASRGSPPPSAPSGRPALKPDSLREPTS